MSDGQIVHVGTPVGDDWIKRRFFDSDAAPRNPIALELPPSADTLSEPAPASAASAAPGAEAPLFANGVRLHSTDGRVYVASHVTKYALTLTRADTGPRRDRQRRKFEKAERRRLRAARQLVVNRIDAAVAHGERPQVDW